MASERIKHTYDKFGILSSLICILHCTIIPILFTLLANLNHPFEAYSFSIDLLFGALAFVAVYFSSRNAHSNSIKGGLWFFLFIFLGGIVVENYSSFGKVIALSGSTGLIVVHCFNIRMCRKST